MSMLADNLWHMVQDTCIRGKIFLHDDAGRPYDTGDEPSKRYRQMMQMSEEFEAQNENKPGPALDDVIADLIANRP